MNYLEIEKVIGRQIIDSTAPLESSKCIYKTGEISIGIYGGRPVWKRFIEVVLNLRIMTIF